MTDRDKTFFITTPIYYPSADLHIGHAYTTVAADAIARFQRLQGRRVFFLTGTDEHGQKIERTARKAGKDPQAFVDEVVAGIRRLWERLDISNDDFIRTTEPRHERAVQAFFQRLYDSGDIYKADYEGWYCTPCESFWLERQLVTGNCPDCGRPVERVREESYFFRLSRYADRLLEHIDAHPDFIQPPSRRNEMVSFIKSGLDDLSVSRTTFAWGVPVPFDKRHIVYVWFDALINYITAAGYPDGAGLSALWPADVHLVGKEIVRFHSVIWPIMLFAAGLEIPRQVFGHGWLVLGGAKISKSRGNIIDPHVLMDRYGVDAVRYFLLREIPFGADGHYTEDALVARLNADLANDLGNLVYRTLNMVERFCGGHVPAPGDAAGCDGGLPDLAARAVREAGAAMGRLELSAAIESLWRLVARSNKFIDEMAPWALAKAGDRARLGSVLYNLCECLRALAIALSPIMPRTAQKMWEQVGLDGRVEERRWDDAAQWGLLPAGAATRRGAPLFPRVDLEAEAEAAAEARVAAPAGAAAPAAPDKTTAVGGADAVDTVSIEEFGRLELRVAEVKAAERVAGADRLLRLQLDLGGETRQVVAGIAAHYDPAALVGRRVVVVANLKPAVIRGQESRGMVLAAVDGDRVSLLGPDQPVALGSKVR
jgi:methionyl-tRNA synthetase